MTDTAENTTPEDIASPVKHTGYLTLNAELNLWADDHTIQYDKDREAVQRYFLDHVNPNTVFFHSLEEKLKYLVDEQYYEAEFLEKYDMEFIKGLYKKLYAHKFRFPTFVGAYKYYTSYTLKTFNGQRYLERFEDRVAVVALYLADGNKKLAEHTAEEMITGRFQPATPTFNNAGKAQRGDLVSCYLIDVADDMNSIGRAINSSLQLSKRGGGVALNLTNVRAKGDPIKKIENMSSGVIPVMKLLEDSFSYSNQLGQRAGAGATYLHSFHYDILDFLDTKRENADEKIRIKTLSLGVIIPDILFELARNKEPMYLFSPYDLEKVYGKQMSELDMSAIYREAVDNPNIRKKKTDPRDFLSTIAEIQMESGYPYILFQDAANRGNSVPGTIKMSNLCSEILQPQEPSTINDGQQYETLGKDISCNLASLNILKALQSPDFGRTVETAIRALTQVSDFSDVPSVPTIQAGNRRAHAIGLGAMNLHGAFGNYHMFYGDEESLDLTNMYFYMVAYHGIRASSLIAKEKKESFDGFDRSDYATGVFFDKFINPAQADMFKPQTDKVKKIVADNGLFIPTPEDWVKLAAQVKKHGMYNQNLFAVPPTGSISYINSSTSSIHPAAALIESRKEGKMGTVYVPAAGFEGNEEYFEDAYDVGPMKLIDVYSIAQFYTDQGLSLTTFYPDTATTRDINKGVLYAFSKGKVSSKEPDERQLVLNKFPQGEIKTMYYIRLKQSTLDGASNYEECVSCTL